MGRNLNDSALLSFYGVQLGSDTDFFMMEGCTYQSGCTVLIRASGRNGRVLSSDEWDDFWEGHSHVHTGGSGGSSFRSDR